MKLLGHGLHAKVYKGIVVGTGQAVAVKVSKAANDTARKYVEMEAAILHDLRSHRCVLAAEPHGTATTRCDSKHQTFLPLELFPMDLFTYLSSHLPAGRLLPSTTVSLMARQLLSAVAAAHKQHIYHLDIKPENVMVDPATHRIALGDFSLAWRKPAASPTPKCGIRKRGTLTYQAPEVRSGHRAYDAGKADSWSLGVVLFTSVFRMPPWKEASLQDQYYLHWHLYTNLVSLNFVSAANKSRVHPTLMDVIRGLLCIDPASRYSVEHALELLGGDIVDTTAAVIATATATATTTPLPLVVDGKAGAGAGAGAGALHTTDKLARCSISSCDSTPPPSTASNSASTGLTVLAVAPGVVVGTAEQEPPIQNSPTGAGCPYSTATAPAAPAATTTSITTTTIDGKSSKRHVITTGAPRRPGRKKKWQRRLSGLARHVRRALARVF